MRKSRTVRASELRPGMTLLSVPYGDCDDRETLRFGQRITKVIPSDEPGGPALLVQTRWHRRWCYTLDPADHVEILDEEAEAAALAEYRAARRALDELAARQITAGITEETPEYYAADDRVGNAAANIPWWRRA